MIISTGIDAIEIDRFAHWHTYLTRTLQKVFAKSEIKYCLQNSKKSAERFAVRFAAKEAFFKALSAAFPEINLTSNNVFKRVSVEKYQSGVPFLCIAWNALKISKLIDQKALKVHVSLSHCKAIATAIVIIEKI